MKSIALISSQYLFRDPRYLMYAKSYQKAGFEVTCISLFANITESQKQTELYRSFNCVSLADENTGASSKETKNPSLTSRTKQSDVPKKLSTSTLLTPSNNKTRLTISSKITLSIYSLFIKTNILLKEQLLRPLYIYYLHRKALKAINSKKFQELISDIEYLHGCEFFFGAVAAGYAAKYYNKKFIFDAKEHHRHMVPEFSRITIDFIKKHEKPLFQQAEIIPCVSEPIIDCYKNLYPDFADKFLYMPNCQILDRDIIKKQSSLLSLQKYHDDSHIADYSPILINSTSKYEKRKIKLIVLATYLPFVRGTEYLIQLWEKLDPSNAELHFYLSNLNSIAKKYLTHLCPNTLNKNLYIRPPVKEDEINSTIEQYDIGIIPYLPNATINHLYCCPNKFGQYLRAGLAIMSSDTINIPNQIAKYNIGYVYPTNNIHNAVNIFKKALDDYDLLIEKRKKSLNHYQNNYNWDVCFKNLMTHLEQAQNIEETFCMDRG